jgi:lipoate-protein ligase A
MTPDGWAVERATGSAAAFHARPLEAPLRRSVHVWDVESPALVLGSTQDASVVDAEACAAAGVEVVRRRSGGGAVLLDPGRAVWVDVELPRGDDLWDDDVGRASWWLGERWGAALAAVGVADPHVHRGGMVTSPWSALVCFAGLGPGEVTAGAGGPKVLGISQRRTRAGARFQCAVPLTWDGARLAGLLHLAPDDRVAVADDLADAVAPVAVPSPDVVAAFVTSLVSSIA